MRDVEYDDMLWETYLNQMTLDETASLIANNFGVSAILSVGVPDAPAGDGPDGVGGFTDIFDEEKYGFRTRTTSYPNLSILTASFDKDLMAKRGEFLGEEGLFLGVSEIWAPGVNLHRTPFGGRSFEYFSEDANMNYLAAIPYVNGIQSKGVNAGPKHLTGNDQENNRQGVANFFNEQAFREGALRGAEGGAKVAGAHSLMQAFNRLGYVGCSLSEALNKGVIRGEWGFVGHIETDAIGNSTQGYKAAFTTMLTAGTDSFCLDTQQSSSQAVVTAIKSNDDGYLQGELRRAAKNILHNMVNSNVINGMTSNSVIISITPWWQPALYAAIGVLSVLMAASLIFLVHAKIKYGKTRKGEAAA
jgi:beta-glucosidase